MTETLLVPPIQHDFSAAPHYEGSRALGAEVVIAEEKRVGYMLDADYQTRSAEYFSQYQDVPDTRYAKVTPALRRIVGLKITGDDVKTWLDAGDNPDISNAASKAEAAAVDHDIESETQRIARGIELIGVRQKLSALDNDAKLQVGSYLFKEAPALLINSFNVWWEDKPATLGVVDWLVEESPTGDESETPLLNFLQWHNDRNEKINKDPETIASIERQKKDYKIKLQTAVERGDLPTAALQGIEKVDGVQVTIGDEFETIVLGKLGQYFAADHQFVMAADVEPHVFRHEMTHAVLGAVVRGDIGEAITDHIAEVLETGDPENISPDLKPNSETEYFGRLRLLSALLKGGNIQIPVTQAFEAYMEPGINGPKEQALVRNLNDSFGINIYEFMNAMIGVSVTEKLYLGNDSPTTGMDREMVIDSVATAVRALGAYQQGTEMTETVLEDIESEQAMFIQKYDMNPSEQNVAKNTLSEQTHRIFKRVHAKVAYRD